MNLLDPDDIQGNVLAGFRKDNQLLVFVGIADVDAFRTSMRTIAMMLSSHADVAPFNAAFSHSRLRPESSLSARWTNLAFSAKGLTKLGFSVGSLRDVAFRQGLAVRSPHLGDAWQQDSPGAPATWVIGGPQNECDAVFLLATDSPADLGEIRKTLFRRLSGVDVMLEFEGHTLPAPLTGHEHFGFRDGISQPLVRGVDEGLGRGDELGLPLVWPGEFVFGYPAQRDDSDQPGPVSGIEAPWLRNGSYLVVRILKQDVGAFHTAIKDDAQAARVVGRWSSGAPLMRSPDVDDPDLAWAGASVNAFLYESPMTPDRFGPVPSDVSGARCPLTAHIRRAWPRDTTIDDGPQSRRTTLRLHRILRRGIPYGPPSRSTFASPLNDNVDRGLIFVSYQASIVNQFEFLYENWLNASDFAGPETGCDPFVGAGMPWIEPRGGGYFFSPSITFVRDLALNAQL